MTPETLQALNDSIAHWERMSTGKRQPGESIGHKHCALCQLFSRGGDNYCSRCPIMEWTGKEGCVGTPFEAASDALDDTSIGEESFNYDDHDFMQAAQVELEFLRSLLPT